MGARERAESAKGLIWKHKDPDGAPPQENKQTTNKQKTQSVLVDT